MEEQVGAIAAAMAARGHDVSVYTSDLEQHIDFKRLKDNRQEINGVKIKRSWSIHPPHTTWPVQPFLPFQLLQAEADIVHAYGFLYFPMLATHFVAAMKDWPIVFNPIIDRNAMHKHPRYARWLGERLVKSPVTVADTEWGLKVLEEFGLKVKQFAAVPPGVDVAAYVGVTGKFFAEARKRGERPLLFAGRVARGKGLDIAIRALPAIRQRHPAATLHIIGPDFGALGECQKLTKELELDQYVNFHGYVSRDDLLSAYAGAELLVLPSRYEEFGMVIAEAWAAGTAVVAAASTAIPYVVDDEENGLLFPTDDVVALAERVNRLLTDDAAREAMASCGREKVRRQYDWPIIFDQLAGIYREVIGNW